MSSKQTLINSLEKQLEELQKMAAMEVLDFTEEIKSLTEKIETLKASEAKPEPNTAWKKVQMARDKNRYSTLDYIGQIVDDFVELHGDRRFKDDQAIIGGIGFLGDQPVTVIGHQKGRDLEENIKRNFGMAHPEGYRKALRLMQQAEKFNRPIICFIDTPGAYCGLGAEERGQGEAIARNLIEMAGLKVPVISIIIGEGGSGGALALGVADSVWMLENAIYSILSPEGFATILWKDATRAPEAAEVMKITADDLKSFGIIDQTVKEPNWIVEHEKVKFAKRLKMKLAGEIRKLKALSTEELVATRYDKFRSMGEFIEQE